MSHLKGFFKRSLHRSPARADTMSSSSESDSKGPITIAVVGCGQRGSGYATYCLAHPEEGQIVACAEPRPKTRSAFSIRYALDHSLVFSDWRDLLAASAETIATVGKRLADAVLVTVQDSMHCEVVVAFAEQGYHILCEKPMATSVEDCIKMKDAVDKAGSIFGLGHVLRYSSYTHEISEIVRSGSLGELINIVHIEPVGFLHFSHSYVRGNWGNEKESSFSLMTKSCHDIDLLCHWLFPATPTRVSSFGSLKHFRKESKPRQAGNATRCLECPVQTSCAYSAKKIYLDPITNAGYTSWPISVLVDGTPDIENITDALKTGPYGQCVYESPNDVCDHQVVNLEFSNGSTCSFTMVAFTSLTCERQTRMHFTHGEIVGDMTRYTVTDFRKSTGKMFNQGVSTVHKPKQHDERAGSHGGGDLGLIKAFIDAVRDGKQEHLKTDVEDVLRSHIAVFAAEESRKTGRVVDVEEFEKEVRERMKAAEPQVEVKLVNGSNA